MKEIERIKKAVYDGGALRRIDSKSLLAEIDRLTAELAKEKARAERAIEDMSIMALAMRESDELVEGCCFACYFEAENLPDNVMLAYGECPGYETDKCFKWRGLDDALNWRR